MTNLRCLPFFAAVLPAIWLGAGPGQVVSFDPPTGPGPFLVQTPAPEPGPTPAPSPEPAVEPSSTPEPTVITQIFKVVFSAETLSEALEDVVENAVEQEAPEIEVQILQMSSLIAEILKAPIGGYFAEISSGTLATAAALAPALFVVRLALYHWNRLVGEEDALLRVFGDWLAAGFLAVSAGPFLDVIVQTGWWMANAAVGETNELAAQFIAATKTPDVFSNLLGSVGTGIIALTILIAGWLGRLIGVVGMAAAVATSQAVLFVLAIVAPVVAVMAVVPQMRWLRGLWLKSVAVLALLPVAAGGIFKAGVSLAAYFDGGGLAAMLIRLFWLWGAVGFLLSLAGILGKMTLSSAIDTTVRLGKAIGSLRSNSDRSGRGSPDSTGDAKAPSKSASQPAAQAPVPPHFLFETALEAPQYLPSRLIGGEVSRKRVSPESVVPREPGTDIAAARSDVPAQVFTPAGSGTLSSGEEAPGEFSTPFQVLGENAEESPSALLAEPGSDRTAENHRRDGEGS